jgi:hypothetical protein
MKILSIEFIYGANEDAEKPEDEDEDDEDDRYSDRQIIVKAKTPYGVEVAKIDPCWESCGTYGAQSTDFLVAASGIGQKFNPWLHGGELHA